MNARSLDLLEYESLRALIARYTGSEPGRRLLASIEPVSGRAALETALSETREAVSYLQEAAAPQTRSSSAAAPVAPTLGPASRGCASRARHSKERRSPL
jgi:dsDNA-specific endonuclease/ATPase MutS2